MSDNSSSSASMGPSGDEAPSLRAMHIRLPGRGRLIDQSGAGRGLALAVLGVLRAECPRLKTRRDFLSRGPTPAERIERLESGAGVLLRWQMTSRPNCSLYCRKAPVVVEASMSNGI